MQFNHVGFGGAALPVPVLEQVTAPDGTRFYDTPSGAKYPSVTTVLAEKSRSSILDWRKRVGNNVANAISYAAAHRGTGLHNSIEQYLKNHPVEFGNILIRDMFSSMTNQLSRINNIHAQETRLYSHHLRLAGTVDCIAEFDGHLSIIDFKSSSRVKKKEWISTYFMQCAAYAVMYEELTNIPVSQLVVMIGVEDEPEPTIFVEKRDDWVKELLHWRDFYETKNQSLTTIAE